MARRRIDTNRLIAMLGVAVLVLGALSVYALTRGAGIGFEPPTPQQRALAQLRDALGPDIQIRYIQQDRAGILCGYAGGDGQGVSAFISRPNRLLLGGGPLLVEFEAMMREDCPGFLRPPPPVS